MRSISISSFICFWGLIFIGFIVTAIALPTHIPLRIYTQRTSDRLSPLTNCHCLTHNSIFVNCLTFTPTAELARGKFNYNKEKQTSRTSQETRFFDRLSSSLKPQEKIKMTLTGYPNLESILPTPEEAKEAKNSTKILAAYLENNSSPETLKLIIDEKEGKAINIPPAALPLLVGILSLLSQGNTVKLTSITEELADYQVADILGVSRHYVWELMNSGEIPYQIVRNIPRMLYKDVMEYKNKTYEEAQKALDEMVAEAEAMGLYD